MIVKTRTNVYDFNFHLVWVTKYRKEVFNTKEKSECMREILIGIATEHDISIQKLEIMPDHIHMIISFNPKHAPSSIVKTLKGKSARLWFKQFPNTKEILWNGHLWSPSYFMSTLGDMSKNTVENYIKNQLTEFNGGRPRC